MDGCPLLFFRKYVHGLKTEHDLHDGSSRLSSHAPHEQHGQHHDRLVAVHRLANHLLLTVLSTIYNARILFVIAYTNIMHMILADVGCMLCMA